VFFKPDLHANCIHCVCPPRHHLAINEFKPLKLTNTITITITTSVMICVMIAVMPVHAIRVGAVEARACHAMAHHGMASGHTPHIFPAN
jgi:hypothetical protein